VRVLAFMLVLLIALPALGDAGQTAVIGGQEVRWFTLEQAQKLAARLKELKLLEEELAASAQLVTEWKSKTALLQEQITLTDEQLRIATEAQAALQGRVVELEAAQDDVYWWAAGGALAGAAAVVAVVLVVR
jgi:hypothetical protein